MKKLIATLIAATSIASVQAGETIRFGMEATYPPFEFIGDNNQIEGFDVDLANAICQELKAECSFNNQPFDSLIPSLKFRRFDAIISGMDITPARQKQVDFSQPYYENSAIFIAKKDTLDSIDQLKGKSVGVQNGSTHQQYVIDKLEANGVTVRPYDSVQNAFLDMTSGRVNAVFADTAVANEWMTEKGEGQYQHVGAEIKNPEYFGIGYGIAVRKGNELKGKIDVALNTLKNNGTYQKIQNKYFAN
ncbi:arginine ABC transporter substrate-binding protein [Endozoicomonas sp. OPT23]|uniref:arginine ABC transporter substrate-binding protein n=1 Tax=Endozoicomonas sp. OPT23 TaxID=2072845 RepID=UPI00129B7DDC|nr:arginine ABC transporter substrate-binding protein [Endozoicomonas sp. OPT23]MRI33679.1 arginine ABC transporter substrate-binding protein [Endozoicomonas sp. OPT23]